MIARMCVVALTLGGSILSTQAGQLSVTTATGARLQLDCRSPQASADVANLGRPLYQVIDQMREVLLTSGEPFKLQDQALSPRRVAGSFRVVYEVLPPAKDNSNLQVRAYIDLDLAIVEPRRARLVDEVAERAGIAPELLKRDLVIDGSACEVTR